VSKSQHVIGTELSGPKTDLSGAVSGVQKIKWSGSGTSSDRSGDGLAKSAAQNPLHHKTTQSRKLKNRF